MIWRDSSIAFCGYQSANVDRNDHQRILWVWFQKDFEERAHSKSKDMQAYGFERILGEFSQEFAHLGGLAQEL